HILPSFPTRRSSDLCFGPDAPAVARDYALDCCEANARAFKLGVPMQPLKRGKKLPCVRHVEPGTVVSDVEDVFLLLGRTPKCYARCRLLRGVLPRVPEQVR